MSMQDLTSFFLASCLLERKALLAEHALARIDHLRIETYRHRLITKLGIENLPALVKFAIRHGITTLE